MKALLRPRPRSAAAVVGGMLLPCAAFLLWSPHTQAQSHTVSEGLYTLRASTVAAGNLPEAMLREHGISADPSKAVLNVMVQQEGGTAPANVAAELKVQVKNLYGVKTDLDMREVMANGQVSYLGVYDFLPREVLDFTVVAHPTGGRDELRLQFRDRLVAPR